MTSDLIQFPIQESIDGHQVSVVLCKCVCGGMPRPFRTVGLDTERLRMGIYGAVGFLCESQCGRETREHLAESPASAASAAAIEWNESVKADTEAQNKPPNEPEGGCDGK